MRKMALGKLEIKTWISFITKYKRLKSEKGYQDYNRLISCLCIYGLIIYEIFINIL